jgi:hypothetical protein
MVPLGTQQNPDLQYLLKIEKKTPKNLPACP